MLIDEGGRSSGYITKTLYLNSLKAVMGMGRGSFAGDWCQTRVIN